MNKKEAFLCAIVAKAAYANSCDSKDFTITGRFYNQATDTQGLLGVAFNNTFVVAFRGSEETGIADWMTDAKFLQTKLPFGPKSDDNLKVHQGFIEAYNSVRVSVLQMVQQSPHQRVITTGHSLGGALATLCALDVAENISAKTTACYTFGSPRVGNPNFAVFYNKLVPQTFRIVNGADLIPELPPGAYEHVGQFHQVGQLPPKDERWSAMVSNFISNTKSKVEDHLPHNYVKMLQSLL